jgi:glycosyl transferase family 25
MKYITFLLTITEPLHVEVKQKAESLSSSIGPVKIFQGVDGRKMPSLDYFKEMLRSYEAINAVLTPGEIGCSLSHRAMMEEFLVSDQDFAIVFEDDIIIDENSVDILNRAMPLLGPNDMLLAGGHEGADHGPIFAKRIGRERSEFVVSRESWGRIKRSCAYVIGRKAARHIVEVQTRSLVLADDYQSLCPPNGRLLFCPAFKHPVDLSQSAIEVERLLKPRSIPAPLLTRISKECGVGFHRRVRSITHFYYAKTHIDLRNHEMP